MGMDIDCDFKSNKTNAFGLDMVHFLSHTSHPIKPLDVSYFKPFKTNLKKEGNSAKKMLKTKQDQGGCLSRHFIGKNTKQRKYYIWI
jgi:hypothetical protein